MFYKFDIYKKPFKKLREYSRRTQRDEAISFSESQTAKVFLKHCKDLKKKNINLINKYDTYSKINQTFTTLCKQYREKSFEQYFK